MNIIGKITEILEQTVEDSDKRKELNNVVIAGYGRVLEYRLNQTAFPDALEKEWEEHKNYVRTKELQAFSLDGEIVYPPDEPEDENEIEIWTAVLKELKK